MAGIGMKKNSGYQAVQLTSLQDQGRKEPSSPVQESGIQSKSAPRCPRDKDDNVDSDQKDIYPRDPSRSLFCLLIHIHIHPFPGRTSEL